ncbi:NTP transferase domain-containing protein [Rhodoplanes sp. TEM]|uniref:NTP transferase domain-containing protein n=1 Tax=Rhodoplanes tepidamans TaxID=200616 RepID=A0ABT5J7F6_RHOTP|nr:MULTISPECIES: NTP transferase domain-containing protein [Rhodoplanes]MDC7785224.1 NTP transferase domain-containing protein [Rhodoplanes tepidamans]MDC7986424.1 NTP transferase domain-containing protein [Rhodoplanes sp. TEM]MDQ0353482.1 putative nucleotidyltransferase with HDIG domain [Rhodoplanes tepidamans]
MSCRPRAVPLRPEVAAVVLAAGRSTRMGAFKPLLPFGGAATVLDHVVGRLRAAGIDRIHVVVGHKADETTKAAARLGAVAVRNPDVDRGMFSSVQVGIGSLPIGVAGCLLLPVDIPLLRATTLARIAAAAVETGAAILHPAFRGVRGHPPFIAAALFDTIGRADPGGSLRGVLEAHEAARPSAVRELVVFDRGSLRDMDHPADYRCLVAALAHDRAPDPEECEAMLDAAATGASVRAHGRAVAALAVTLAERLVAAGLRLDVDLVRAGALVHDIAKGRDHHAETGAAMLRAFGFPEVARIVARHMEIAFDGETLDEAVIVHLADKLVAGERRVTLAERFAPGLARFRDDPAAIAGARRRLATAEAILDAVVLRLGGRRGSAAAMRPPAVAARRATGRAAP